MARVSRSARRLLALVAIFACGSLIGLVLRLACFLAGALAVRALGEVIARLAAQDPSLDPVYTRAAQRSLLDLRLQGLAVGGPLGDWLHQALPDWFVASARAHWALVRIAVEPGSPVLARLLASAIAHAVTLSVSLLVVRHGWRHHRTSIVIVGLAMQIQVAVSVLGARPSVRELDATGVSFAANALVPWLAPRGASLTDWHSAIWPPLTQAALVGLALLVGYLPVGLVLLLRDRLRRLTFATAAAVMVGSAACAGVLRQDLAATGIEAAPPVVAPQPDPKLAPVAFDNSRTLVAARTSTRTVTALDRWFAEPAGAQPASPSRVQIIGTNFHYEYRVNGQPQLIKGMGLNTQYATFLSPSDRVARIDADMAELHALGVNTVLGWDPAEFDGVLLNAAQRNDIGVVMPFDLDPEADYTDPAVRVRLRDEVLAWVARYRNYPALRMWGLGNEVLHKIVHPAWVGPQDPQRQRQAEAFSDWLVQTADDIHTLDPDHPVTYRSAEDAFVDWVIAVLNRRGGGERPWFVWGTNCYQAYLGDIVDHWTELGMPAALWVSEFAPGGMAVADRPDGFATMWSDIRRHPDWVLGGAVYAWTRNGPEGVDRNFGLTDDGVPVDGRSLDMLSTLFHSE